MLTEKEYRKLEIDSYSSIKDFIEDKKKYYRKYVLKERVSEEESASLIFGSLVDCLLFTPAEYEDRYCLSVAQIPTGQYAELTRKLMNITIASTDENGVVGRELADMLLDAYNAVKFDRDGNIVDFKRDSFETVKGKFVNSQYETYYRQLREAHGKTIIELSTLENAQNVVRELKTNFVTKDIMNTVSTKNITVYDQLPIIGEVITEITKSTPYPLKGLLDRVIVDHTSKAIFIYDFKTAWDNENEFLFNYFKYRYYIQAAVYFYLTVEWKKKDKRIADYAVHYPAFIVAESSNYKNPLIYMTNQKNFDQGMRGFILKGKYYPGVVKAIKDLIWHKEMGLWNIAKTNYDNNGIIKIEPFAE